MKFHEKINRLLAERGMDQADLVPDVGVSRNTVSRWCNGKGQPTLGAGLRLARRLGVALEYLADDDQDEPPPGPGEPDPRLTLVHQAAERLGWDEVLDRVLNAPPRGVPGERAPGTVEWMTRPHKPG